jgi:hypothetical protein
VNKKSVTTTMKLKYQSVEVVLGSDFEKDFEI